VRVTLGARHRPVMLQVDERATVSVTVLPQPPGKNMTDAPRRPAAEGAGAVTEPHGDTVHSLIDWQDHLIRREEEHAVRCGGLKLWQPAEGTEHGEP
jgi:hypothetical protein